MQNKIALIFDFDDTLSPDTVSRFLEFIGHDPKPFWKNIVDPLLDEGWDPATSYIYSLIELSKSLPEEKKITLDRLVEWGKQLPYYNGVPSLFKNLKKETSDIAENKEIEIDLDFYIISSGIGDILRSSSIAQYFSWIWACEMHYDKFGEINFPKNIISFTDKTRYLFQISKGIVGEEFSRKPFEVNKKIAPGEYNVPFSQMIFVGDGYTDVPCFSLVQKNGGIPIAVFDKSRRDKWERSWRFAEEKRVMHLASTDYRKSSDLYSLLVMAIEKICNSIALNNKTFTG